jgi:hypothetical protein
MTESDTLPIYRRRDANRDRHDPRYTFEVTESPPVLFLATVVRLYDRDVIVEEKTLWRSGVEFEVPLEDDDGSVRYVFEYLQMGAASLCWKRFRDGRLAATGYVRITNHGTAVVALYALIVWSVVWFGWILPRLFERLV